MRIFSGPFPLRLWKTLPMIKTEFCFPQLHAENQYLLPTHCLHLQDIKETGGPYQFRRWRKRERYEKSKSC